MPLSLSELERLDSGDYVAAIADRSQDDLTSSGPLVAAEIALYSGRHEEAEHLVETFSLADVYLSSVGERGELARRVYLIRADAAVGARRFEDAERLTLAVLEAADVVGDQRSRVRARIVLASILLRRAAYRPSIECSMAAEADAVGESLSFFRGRAAYLRGYAHNHLGETIAAESALAEAVALLSTCENGRYTAAARNLLGVTMVDQGRPREALPLFEEAERGAVELGLVDDVLYYRVNAEHALYELGDFKGAVARFHTLALQEREHRHPAETKALYWLAQAACELKDRDSACDAARSMLTLAELQGNAVDVVDARLALGRASVDAEMLLDLVAHPSPVATDRQLAEARLFAAEAISLVDPSRAARLLEEATAYTRIQSVLSLARIVERLQKQTGRATVRMDSGVLTVDVTTTWLTADQAHDVMESFIYSEALRRTAGNQRAAARLLGRAESDVHRKRKKYGL